MDMRHQVDLGSGKTPNCLSRVVISLGVLHQPTLRSVNDTEAQEPGIYAALRPPGGFARVKTSGQSGRGWERDGVTSDVKREALQVFPAKLRGPGHALFAAMCKRRNLIRGQKMRLVRIRRLAVV